MPQGTQMPSLAHTIFKGRNVIAGIQGASHFSMFWLGSAWPWVTDAAIGTSDFYGTQCYCGRIKGGYHFYDCLMRTRDGAWPVGIFPAI